MQRIFGLIGYPLGHSFSKKYFSEKFERGKIEDTKYELFEIKDISEVRNVFKTANLSGLNVTIPYKEKIIPYLDRLEYGVAEIGAVNVVKISGNGTKVGFNADYYGFKLSLDRWLSCSHGIQALVLGTGGASKAIRKVLEDLDIIYLSVSRSKNKGDVTYESLHRDPSLIQTFKLIINTTPLGMSPKTTIYPDLPYKLLGPGHYLYDLVYNPTETLFMKKGKKMGAHVKNGHEMLVLQAEKSWEIWNS